MLSSKRNRLDRKACSAHRPPERKKGVEKAVRMDLEAEYISQTNLFRDLSTLAGWDTTWVSKHTYSHPPSSCKHDDMQGTLRPPLNPPHGECVSGCRLAYRQPVEVCVRAGQRDRDPEPRDLFAHVSQGRPLEHSRVGSHGRDVDAMYPNVPDLVIYYHSTPCVMLPSPPP